MIRNYIRDAYRAGLSFVYARRKFKLLLKQSSEYTDLRLWQLASVADFFSPAVRPVPIRAPFGDSMLVVAPHQDDEAIGCGGAVALQVRASGAASIVILQDGADGHAELGMERRTLSELRNQESRYAASVAGLENPCFFGFADLEADAPLATEQLHSILFNRRVDAVFVPFPFDAHPDHLAANYILRDALASIPWNVRVFGYEVWGLCIPNVIVIIDEVINIKSKMLSCFTFANKALNYTHSTKGLNMYHSRLLGAGTCEYAECFFEMPKTEYIDLIERIRLAALESQRSRRKR